ncbi:MAG: diguanylate cyclase [Lachnospiraceae bacterium]
MRKILIVDDNRLNLKILEDILLEEGYEIHCLSDSTQVVDTVTSLLPDAIFLDLIMPGLDGFCVCDLLQNQEELQNIPIIIMTSLSGTGSLDKAFEKGAFDFIRKPFDKVEVQARLKSALRYYDQHRILEHLAMRDGLTNLYNHRYSMEYLRKECFLAKENGYPIAFMMLDIDYFKSVNDTFGHKAGDLILKEVSKLLQEIVDCDGLVGRYGGEEFSVTLNDWPLPNVLELAEKLRRQIEDHIFWVSEEIKITITLSIGISYSETDVGKRAGLLVEKADHGLYKAKDTGRNRVIHQIL